MRLALLGFGLLVICGGGESAILVGERGEDEEDGERGGGAGSCWRKASKSSSGIDTETGRDEFGVTGASIDIRCCDLERDRVGSGDALSAEEGEAGGGAAGVGACEG